MSADTLAAVMRLMESLSEEERGQLLRHLTTRQKARVVTQPITPRAIPKARREHVIEWDQ